MRGGRLRGGAERDRPWLRAGAARAPASATAAVDVQVVAPLVDAHVAARLAAVAAVDLRGDPGQREPALQDADVTTFASRPEGTIAEGSRGARR